MRTWSWVNLGISITPQQFQYPFLSIPCLKMPDSRAILEIVMTKRSIHGMQTRKVHRMPQFGCVQLAVATALDACKLFSMIE